MKLDGIVIMIFFSLMGFVAGGSLIYSGITLEAGDEERKCFDRFSNEIIGETCIKKTTESELILSIFLGVMIMFTFPFVGYMMGDMLSSNHGL